MILSFGRLLFRIITMIIKNICVHSMRTIWCEPFLAIRSFRSFFFFSVTSNNFFFILFHSFSTSRNFDGCFFLFFFSVFRVFCLVLCVSLCVNIQFHIGTRAFREQHIILLLVSVMVFDFLLRAVRLHRHHHSPLPRCHRRYHCHIDCVWGRTHNEQRMRLN